MRLFALDYLRGLAAFGIMIYHFTMWAYGPYDVSNPMGRVGIYAVPVFYILSGLTLFSVYKNKMDGLNDWLQFFIKRLFRILPLLWVATLVSIPLLHQSFSFNVIAANLTGLFGLVLWNGGIATGVWSIGNEMVFYAIFPLLMLSIRYRAFFIPLILSLGCYVYFAWFKIEPNTILEEQWKNYVNPLNQVFLFVLGVGLAMVNKWVKPGASPWLILFAVLLFIFNPVSGDQVNIVIQGNRLFFTVVCLLICFAFLNLKKPLPYLDKPLSKLGEISYSLYLLHPLLHYGMNELNISPVIQLFVGVPLSLGLAFFVFQFYEKPFMKLGAIVNTHFFKRKLMTQK